MRLLLGLGLAALLASPAAAQPGYALDTRGRNPHAPLAGLRRGGTAVDPSAPLAGARHGRGLMRGSADRLQRRQQKRALRAARGRPF